MGKGILPIHTLQVKYRKGNLKKEKEKEKEKKKKKKKNKKEKKKKKKKKKRQIGKKEILWTMRARRKNRCGDAGWVRCSAVRCGAMTVSQQRA